jgi:hypothetical protein
VTQTPLATRSPLPEFVEALLRYSKNVPLRAVVPFLSNENILTSLCENENLSNKSWLLLLRVATSEPPPAAAATALLDRPLSHTQRMQVIHSPCFYEDSNDLEVALRCFLGRNYLTPAERSALLVAASVGTLHPSILRGLTTDYYDDPNVMYAILPLLKNTLRVAQWVPESLMDNERMSELVRTVAANKVSWSTFSEDVPIARLLRDRPALAALLTHPPPRIAYLLEDPGAGTSLLSRQATHETWGWSEPSGPLHTKKLVREGLLLESPLQTMGDDQALWTAVLDLAVHNPLATHQDVVATAKLLLRSRSSTAQAHRVPAPRGTPGSTPLGIVVPE